MRAMSACGMCHAQAYGLLVRLKLTTCVRVCSHTSQVGAWPLVFQHCKQEEIFSSFSTRLLMLSHDWACRAAHLADFCSFGVWSPKGHDHIWNVCLYLFVTLRSIRLGLQIRLKNMFFLQQNKTFKGDTCFFGKNIRIWGCFCVREGIQYSTVCVFQGSNKTHVDQYTDHWVQVPEGFCRAINHRQHWQVFLCSFFVFTKKR